MDFWIAMGVATAASIVVAFTTMPILTVIAVLLGTGRESRGWWLTGGYVVGLGILFAVAALGANLLDIPRLHIDAWVQLVAGVVLIGAGLIWLYRIRRRNRAEAKVSRHRFFDWLGTVGPVTCTVVGFQYAFHPENLVLTVAAASRTSSLDWLSTLIVGVWFCIIGVSTVAVPTLMFGRAGPEARARLQRVQNWIVEHGSVLTCWLLLGAGVLLLGIGIWRLF